MKIKFQKQIEDDKIAYISRNEKYSFDEQMKQLIDTFNIEHKKLKNDLRHVYENMFLCTRDRLSIKKYTIFQLEHDISYGMIYLKFKWYSMINEINYMILLKHEKSSEDDIEINKTVLQFCIDEYKNQIAQEIDLIKINFKKLVDNLRL